MQSHLDAVPLSGVAVADTAAGPATKGTYVMPYDCYLWGIKAIVTTAVTNDLVAAVVSVDSADTDGTTNAVERATLTCPDNSAIGTEMITTLVTPVLITAGRTIVLKHKTSGTDSMAAAGALLLYGMFGRAGRDVFRTQ